MSHNSTAGSALSALEFKHKFFFLEWGAVTMISINGGPQRCPRPIFKADFKSADVPAEAITL
jgi:hypothetical protein